MKPSEILCAIILIVFSLYGCGGGSGSPTPAQPAVMPTPPEVTPTPPEVTPTPPVELPHAPLKNSIRAAQAPLFDSGGALHIGMVDAPPSGELQKTGERNAVEISQGSTRDGSSATDVIAYLHPRTIHTETDLTGLATFPSSPNVLVVKGTDERFTDLTLRAVQIVNAALPLEKRISFGDAPALDPVYVDEVPRGDIYIEFIPQAQWPEDSAPDEHAVGNTQSQSLYRHNPQTRRDEILEAYSSHILIDSEGVRSFSEERIVYVIVHELLHALGFSGHTKPVRFPDATLNPEIPNRLPRFLLSLIDRDALLAAYDRFSYGAQPEQISAENLGVWSEESLHVRGDLGIPGGEVSFGVALRNGFAQPWATGPEPARDLAQNGALSGTVTWSGALVGVGSSSETVAGDSLLSVNLSSLSGQLDFTNMEKWEADEAPGEVGSGTTWGDGDLGYTIAVRGNAFSRTGGDDGEVTGAFFGARHEGMGGVLERTDLSAGFGGKR